MPSPIGQQAWKDEEPTYQGTVVQVAKDLGVTIRPYQRAGCIKDARLENGGQNGGAPVVPVAITG